MREIGFFVLMFYNFNSIGMQTWKYAKFNVEK